MEAVNPLCRYLLLASTLTAIIGCQSDSSGVKARGQMPQDPRAPIAPPSQPPSSSPPSVGPLAPVAPVAPGSPVSPGNQALSVAPPVPGSPIPGSPVPLEARTNGRGVRGEPLGGTSDGIVQAKYAGGISHIATAAELLRKSTPQVKVVAIVGANNVITDQEVREGVYQQMQLPDNQKLQGREHDEKVKELYTQTLRSMIERELILDDMYSRYKKMKKMAMVDEIKEAALGNANMQLRAFKRQLGITNDEKFALFLSIQGLTLPVMRRQFERQFIAGQYIHGMIKEKGRQVGLGEVRDYFDKHPDEFKTPDRVKWQHIFISIAQHPSQPAAYQFAESLRQKAVSGQDFAALSKQYDEGFAKMQHGFGTGELRDSIQPPDLEPVVWSMKPGEVSRVLSTPTGLHIVKIVERSYTSVRPFDTKVQTQIRDILTQKVTEEETQKMIENLWRKGVVRVFGE